MGLALDIDTANAELGKWLRDVANQRVHPVTRSAPATLLEEVERAALQPLPSLSASTVEVITGSDPELSNWTRAMNQPLQHPLSVYQNLLTQVPA